MDEQIFLQYQTSKVTPNITNHVMFDPLKTFNGLDNAQMDKHINHEIYKDITPWQALVKVLAVPVIMLALIVAVPINILLKIILIFMIIIHVVISTSLISSLYKKRNENINTTQTVDSNGK